MLDWVSLGCLAQVTGSALTGRWGRRARAVAEWLLENDAVHVLATDAHGTEDRTPVLSSGRNAAAEIVGMEKATALVDDNPRAIVDGLALPDFSDLVLISYRRYDRPLVDAAAGVAAGVPVAYGLTAAVSGFSTPL